MTAFQLARIKADLHRYLRDTKPLISLEFSAVVADVTGFTAAILQKGFRKALAQLPNTSEGLSGRPFIEVADVIVEHHLRFVKETEREIARKSLLEAYIHAAGPRDVFAPPGKTRLVTSLRRAGPRNFAALLFSLHTFNVVCMTIQDKVRTKMPDVQSFELYMLGAETICRDIVTDAVKTQGTELDERWARAVAESVEAELLHLKFKGTKSQSPSIFTGQNKK